MLADIKHQLLELLVSIGFIPVNIERRRRLGEDGVFAITGEEVNLYNIIYRCKRKRKKNEQIAKSKANLLTLAHLSLIIIIIFMVTLVFAF